MLGVCRIPPAESIVRISLTIHSYLQIAHGVDLVAWLCSSGCSSEPMAEKVLHAMGVHNKLLFSGDMFLL